MLRFHLDENIPNSIAVGLRARGRDVTTSFDVQLIGKDDLAQLRFAFSNERVMVSRDQDMLRLASRGEKHAGIVFWTGKKSVGMLIKNLNSLYFEYSPEAMHGTVMYF